MKRWRTVWIVVVVLAALTFAASFPVTASYAGRAALYQRVLVSNEAALFDDVGERVGSPAVLIVDDPKAVLDRPAENGAKFLDEGYMKKNGVYPLQLKTVEYVSSLVRLGSGLAVILGIAGFVWSRRQPKAATGGSV